MFMFEVFMEKEPFFSTHLTTNWGDPLQESHFSWLGGGVCSRACACARVRVSYSGIGNKMHTRVLVHSPGSSRSRTKTTWTFLRPSTLSRSRGRPRPTRSMRCTLWRSCTIEPGAPAPVAPREYLLIPHTFQFKRLYWHNAYHGVF